MPSVVAMLLSSGLRHSSWLRLGIESIYFRPRNYQLRSSLQLPGYLVNLRLADIVERLIPFGECNVATCKSGASLKTFKDR